MTYQRRPSDTSPIDREELDKLLASSVPDEEAPTGIECPACGADGKRSPACPTCMNAGWVTIAVWRTWCASHGGMRIVTCPKCLGQGRHPEIIEKGRWHEVKCSLCQGDKRVRGNVAAAFERTSCEKGDGRE